MATALDINAYGQADLAEAPKPEAPPELIAWLRNEEERAKDSALDEQRAAALDFYNGEPFGDEEEGRSQVVTRDVAEVIDYMVPSVLRTMVSGDKVVEFEALDEGDKEALEEATEAVSQQFMQGQDGWRILHDTLKSGLLEKTGAIKSYVEEEKIRRQQEVGVEEMLMLQAQVELTEAEPTDETEETWRVAWVERRPKFCDEPLPNEEFVVAKDARTLLTAVYYAHRTPKTISELKEMGFAVDDLTWDDGSSASGPLKQARDGATQDMIHRDGAARTVWLMEEYCRYDLNGDGLAELLRVHRVGNNILVRGNELAIEEIEDGPCEEWCPFPMPHRRVGQSLADKVMDIQRTRSVLMRQSLDNLYQSNVPRTLINESSMGDSTVDDILTVRPGALMRWKGSIEPKPWTVPFVADSAFKAMEVLTGERESRTGITRLNQGLDADALNKTATGTAMMQAQGQQIEEYIARNFAEFIGRVFRKKYKLMKDYGQPFSVMMDGKPTQVDPSKWPDEMRVVVRVGLGSGRKEQRVQHRLLLANMQAEAMKAGLRGVGDEQIFNSFKGLVTDLGLGQATDYYADPATMGEAPEKPDPKMLEAQAKATIEAERAQQDQQRAAGEFELKSRQQEIDAALKQQQTEADLQAKREAAALDMQLKREARAEESALAWARLEDERQLAQERLKMDREMKRQGDELPNSRPGGSLAE